MSILNQYVFELQASLGHLDAETRQEIVGEVRGHLEDKARCLQLHGLPKEDSMSRAIEEFGQAQEVGLELRQVHGRGTWGEALLAALPHLLFVLATEMSGLWAYYLMPGQRLPGKTFDLAFIVLYLAVTAYAWWRRWPRWSTPWVGYTMVVFYFLIIITLPGSLHTAAFFAWLIGCAVVFFWLADRNWGTACLAAFSWVPMFWSLLALDEVHPRVEGPLMVAAGVVAVLAVIAFVRGRRPWERVGVLLAANLAIVIPVSWVSIFYSDYPGILVWFPSQPTPLSVAVSLAFDVVVSSALLLGPWWFHALGTRAWRLARSRVASR